MPNILILTEGDSENLTIHEFIKKHKDKLGVTKNIVVRKINYHPLTGKDNARKILEGFRKKIFSKKSDFSRFEKVIMLIDFEDRALNTKQSEKTLLQKILSDVFKEIPCSVVFKVRAYENWLIADPKNLSTISIFGSLSEINQRNIINSGADNLNAMDILNRSSNNKYHKVNDSKRILQKLDAIEMERNSRSFRKFIAELEVPRYSSGSCRFIVWDNGGKNGTGTNKTNP